MLRKLVKYILLDIEARIKKVDNEISETELFLEHGIISLAFYEPILYNKLLVEINNEREKFESTRQRKAFIPIYKKVFLAQRKKMKRILANVINRTIRINPEPTRDEMIKFLIKSWSYNENISHQENIYQYTETRIRKTIIETNEELYILNKFPAVYYNKKSGYIGGEFNYRYENEIIIYNNVNVMSDGMHHFLLYCNDSSTLNDKRALLNILAYLNGSPNFEFLSNTRVNKKLDDLYRQFDLLDCIRLRHPNYLISDIDKAIYLELPIIKKHRQYDIITFEKMPHEGILDLYHASLKQFEPLPRCVFLYRVFEYAAANHYKPLHATTQYKPEDAINYYLNCAMTYNPNPLYFIDFRRENQQAKLINYFTVLKKEARAIFSEWSNNPYLKLKSKGEVIYLTGRNFTAHGASGRKGERNMQYDYEKNYLHINNINIILELIARYVVELLNPELKNVVERKMTYYKNKYDNLFKQFEK